MRQLEARENSQRDSHLQATVRRLETPRRPSLLRRNNPGAGPGRIAFVRLLSAASRHERVGNDVGTVGAGTEPPFSDSPPEQTFLILPHPDMGKTPSLSYTVRGRNKRH